MHAPENPHLEGLKNLSTRLSKLLEDPHPGLLTWCNAVREVIAQMSNWGNSLVVSSSPDPYDFH